MNTGSLCMFVIVCVYVGQYIAVATVGFQQHAGNRDLEEIASGFTAVRGKKYVVLSLPIAVPAIDYQQHFGKRDLENKAGFSAVRGKKNHDLSLPPDVYSDSESLQDKIDNIPIIFYYANHHDRLARLLGMSAIGEDASNSETAGENALPVEIKSLRSKKEKIVKIASRPGFNPTRGKKSFEEYYDEY